MQARTQYPSWLKENASMETFSTDVSGTSENSMVSSDASTVISVWGVSISHPSGLAFPTEIFAPAMVYAKESSVLRPLIGAYCAMNATTGGATSNRMFFEIPFRLAPGGEVVATGLKSNGVYGVTIKVRGLVTVYYTKSTIIV